MTEVLLDFYNAISFIDLIVVIWKRDDFNTFNHVIATLISVCDHTPVQAEQCTLIVHYKGKCSVKSGTLIDLKPRLKKMVDAKLSAEII